MIKIQDLTYTFANQPTLRFSDLSLAKGAACLVLGPSGSGKTTFLHLVAGLLKPQSGSIWIDGKDISALSAKAMDKFRGQHIGIVFQKHHFVASLSVMENIVLAQTLAGIPTSTSQARQLLASMNIAHKAKENPYALSQGEQQRVAIARALINTPALILADEPTSALDDKNCYEVVSLLQDQAKTNNATLIIVTHDTRLTSIFEQKIILS